MTFSETFDRIQEDIGPAHAWPLEIQTYIFSPFTMMYMERMSCVCFLVGNGARKADILSLLNYYARDISACVHIQNCIEDALSPRYDNRWFFFCLRDCCQKYLNGNVKRNNLLTEYI